MGTQNNLGLPFVFATAILLAGSVVESTAQERRTAVGKPAEGSLNPFLDKPVFDQQVVFSDEGGRVREPYLAIAVDGTLLAVRSYIGRLRRSEDAGQTWGKIQDIDIRILDSNLIVDENTGVARLNLSWIIQGEGTGDGDVPQWVRPSHVSLLTA